jgi:phage/plasmid-associated DNA primase
MSDEYDEKIRHLQPVYDTVSADIQAKGFQVVWATRNRKGEWTPLTGTTGTKSAFPSNLPRPDLARIALRPPPGVKIFDVDHYGEKLGGDTIERFEEHTGVTLPATWKLTSRDPASPSGRYLFRVADGLDFKDTALAAFADPGTGATCVDIVRTNHRFSWAPLDINPKNGEMVRVWYGAGEEWAEDRLPPVEEIPFLPEEMQDYLSDPPAPPKIQLPEFDVNSDEWWKQMPANSLGTRDKLIRYSWDLGFTGLSEAEIIDELMRVSVAMDLARPWTREDLSGMVDDNTRQKIHRIRSEWAENERILSSAFNFRKEDKVAQARAEYERAQYLRSLPPDQRAAEVMQDDAVESFVNEQGDIIPEHAETFDLAVVGDEMFDPEFTDDRSLAVAVLDRLGGVKYCADTGAWVVMGKDKWDELSADIIQMAIWELSDLMPEGEAKPEDCPFHDHDDEQEIRALKRQHKNRQYLRSSQGLGNVSRYARAALQVPGQHRVAIRRASLDTAPEVLWAGGVPWDLRTCTPRPDLAAEPHMMTAECAPDFGSDCPMYKELLKIAIPDEEQREFYLDMIALGLTGYQSLRTVPVLRGETKRGKTLTFERTPAGTYMSPVSGQDLLGTGDREEARKLSVLVGLRIPYIDEGVSRGKYAMGRLKKITSGGSKLPARRIFGKEFEFQPVHTLVMLVNPQEMPEYSDDAVKDRLCPVDFDGDPAAIKAFAKGYDPQSAAYQDETPAVLGFLMKRASEILTEKGSKRGTSMAKPALVEQRQEEEAREDDPVQAWIDQFTTEGEQPFKELFSSFEGWWKNTGQYRRHGDCPTKRQFGNKLTALGVAKREGNGMTYRGLKLRGIGS